jgi:DNA/RNA-binding domain of Phe-tRNA-synthetase-like protein
MAGAPIEVTVAPELVGGSVRIAVVWAEGLVSAPSEAEPFPYYAEAAARAAALGEGAWPAGRKAAVRDMLRHGRYKPTGRAKPASEFLLGAAAAGQLPLVTNLVDTNNALSLATGFPASIFDADRLGPALLLRFGQPGESYVFNSAGHAIELEDLVVVCRREGDGWQPCGNPVKDAMATKVHEGTTRVVAVVYGPTSEPEPDLVRAAEQYEALLAGVCGASAARSAVY